MVGLNFPHITKPYYRHDRTPRDPEIPRDFMARFAQCGKRTIFEYRAELLQSPEDDALRCIGHIFRDADAARRCDDRPGNLVAWRPFPTWDAAVAWLYADAQE